MIQLVILGLSILCVLAGVAALGKGSIPLTRTSKLTGAAARNAGIGLIVLAVAMAGFAWYILPQIFR